MPASSLHAAPRRYLTEDTPLYYRRSWHVVYDQEGLPNSIYGYFFDKQYYTIKIVMSILKPLVIDFPQELQTSIQNH